MPTIPYDGTILSILAGVVAVLLAGNFWMFRQMLLELKARTAADIELVKAIIQINNSMQAIKAASQRLKQEMNSGHRAIFDAVETLTKTTIEQERQRRRDD